MIMNMFFIYVYTYMYIDMCVYIHTCIYICMYICICLYRLCRGKKEIVTLVVRSAIVSLLQEPFTTLLLDSYGGFRIEGFGGGL